MADKDPAFPFFIATEARALTKEERAVVTVLLENQSEEFKSQLADLSVVGRCGCGMCPTIFFEAHREGDRESDLVSYIGRDESGGVVGAVLLEKKGALSQLEFYSADGHDPWSIPDAETLSQH
jgi:hypothetical protein